jgi:hypothetical protein
MVSISGGNLCKDVIEAKFDWNSISLCLSSLGDSFLFEGTIFSYASLHDVQYSTGGLSKKQATNSDFDFAQNFSINFQDNFTMYSSDSSFIYESPYGQKSVFFKLISRKFNANNLNLVIVYQVNISTPLALGSNHFFTGNNLEASVSVSSESCDQSYCIQNLTITFDLSQQNCQGVSENSILKIPPRCASGSDQAECQLVLDALKGKNVTLPVSFAISWCPIVEKTSVSPQSFNLYANGALINDKDVVSNVYTIQGIITAQVDFISGTQLSNFSISTLRLTDGNNPVVLDEYVQTFQADAAFATNKLITVEFNHTISPSLALDFSKALSYIADAIVTFDVPSSKRQSRSVSSSSPQSLSIQFNSNNFILKLASNGPSPSPASTDSSSSPSSSRSVVGIAVGVSIGSSFLIILLISFFIYRQKSIKSARGNNQIDDDLELQFQKKHDLN